MEHNFIMNIRKSGNSLCVTIPKQIIKLLKLKKNELVEVNIKKILKGK